MKPAIEVKKLSKMYEISHEKKAAAGSSTLRDAMVSAVHKPLELLTGKKTEKEEFWALKNVSFQVDPGDIVGVIGRNGSGKSTLLKILSRIADPTSGRAVMRGKVASLLEVGTGFHPELTGRENVYFNGAILGMRKQEIDRKFDEIIAFSEIEQFLDTPVKFYSSGMYVRLAFAVAAHLDPDILIVDEVLAVGDAAFQKKSLGKMSKVAGEGRTVIFVSHNMSAMQSLCNKGIFIANGSVVSTGPINEILKDYNESLAQYEPQATASLEGVDIQGITIKGDRRRLTSDSAVTLTLTFATDHPLPNCFVNLHIEGGENQNVIHTRTDFRGTNPSFEPGVHEVKVVLPRLSVRAGVYTAMFRIYADMKDKTHLVDSERLMLEVTKPTEGGLIDIEANWTWKKTGELRGAK